MRAKISLLLRLTLTTFVTVCSSLALAGPNTVRGIKLGMYGLEAQLALPDELQRGSSINQITVFGKEPLFRRYRLNTATMECLGTEKDCSALRAFGHPVPETGGIYLVDYEQSFVEGIPLDALNAKLAEEYGPPALYIPPRVPGRVASAYWVWSDEPFASTPAARQWASSMDNAKEWKGSQPGSFTRAVLHVEAFIIGGDVRRLSVLLFDPTLISQAEAASEKEMQLEREEAARKVQERVRDLKLR
jgi:hypothetical protein